MSPALRLALLLPLALATSCASPSKPGSPGGARPGGLPAAGGPGAPLGRAGYEAGVLSAEARPLAGPLVVTWLAEGTPAALAPTGGGEPLAVVVGPLATPLHVPAGLELRGTGAAGGWTGHRPQSPALARPLEAWIGKQVRVVQGGAAPELFWLREIAADHLVLERSRTYRLLPLRRISEITWTELTGIDRTPVVVVAPE